MPNSIAPAPSPRNRRGNPLGNPGLNLAPRCGARTRLGCPCRGPAVHGGLRCRMHGGRSTGPRTSAGLARSRTARLTHGTYSAETRADMRYQITLQRRTRVFLAVMHCLDRLPATLASRVLDAPELAIPPRPTHRLSAREDQALRRREAAALLPWRDAVKAARGKQDEPHAPVMDGQLPPPGFDRLAALALLRVVTQARAGLAQRSAVAGDEPHAPELDPTHPCSSVFIGGSALPGSQPNAVRPNDDPAPRGNGGVATRNVDEPHAPVLGPPAGLSRKERKRWKWEQRTARKAGGG
jgi:hypothetical protein